MPLEEGFGVGFRWVVGFAVKNEGKGGEARAGKGTR